MLSWRVFACALVMVTAMLLYPARSTAQAAPVPPPAPAAYPSGSGTPLGQQIATLLASGDAARAHWGIAVTALDGTPLYGLDEGKLFRPASTAKLFTTAAAMTLLGPEKTFETDVFGKLDTASGVVDGDLLLRGGGDANFGAEDVPYLAPSQRPQSRPAQPHTLADLAALADQLAAKGLKRVTGQVVGDDTLFPWEPVAEGWAADDLLWGYGAPVSALSIVDNALTLRTPPGTITGAKGRESYAGSTARLDDLGVPFYNVVSRVDVVAPGMASHVDVERMGSERVLRVYGQLASNAPPDTEHVSIDAPALFAAEALDGMLRQRGIAIDHQAAEHHQPARMSIGFAAEMKRPVTLCESETVAGEPNACAGNCMIPMVSGDKLAVHTSPPLQADVVSTLKESLNLHAEVLLHHLGRAVFCGDGSTLSGERMLREYLLHAGLSGDEFAFYDGSGLSTKDLVTPRAEAQLLAYAAKQPWFAQWKAALPVGGVDGTLASRFKDPPLKGHIFAKTGTLGESRALAGYLECASGRTVIFSILVDNHPPGSAADREAMDRIVAAIRGSE